MIHNRMGGKEMRSAFMGVELEHQLDALGEERKNKKQRQTTFWAFPFVLLSLLVFPHAVILSTFKFQISPVTNPTKEFYSADWFTFVIVGMPSRIDLIILRARDS
uniref:Putative serine/threonine-protein kinase At1g09600 isoform X2 n=1 Tax=Rhizophora mucronata TaxID=61149 RepID=A0A2P2QAH3_RHIMU